MTFFIADLEFEQEAKVSIDAITAQNATTVRV